MINYNETIVDNNMYIMPATLPLELREDKKKGLKSEFVNINPKLVTEKDNSTQNLSRPISPDGSPRG
jgi:hypothetical protein